VTYLIKHHAKELFVLNHPMPFFQRGRYENDGHDVIIIRPRKDIRARVVHQLVTKQHRQSGDNTGQMKYCYRTGRRRWDILVCPEKYRTRVRYSESSRSLFTYSPENPKTSMTSVPTTQWRSMLSGGLKRFLQHRISSYAELYTHSMEEKLTKLPYRQ
jgi:hypothetical protein